jgi:hypothetical protein
MAEVLSFSNKPIINDKAKVKLKEHGLPVLNKRFERCVQ